MRLLSISILCASFLAVAAAGSAARVSNATLQRQVADTERAFAATMKARDHAAFTRFVSDEAIFFSGSIPLHGKDAVAKAWRPFYDRPEAPFSWEPDQVEVVDSGTLAYSSGPVYDAKGTRTGRFHSIWRLEAPGVWRVVFDRGSDPCSCQQ